MVFSLVNKSVCDKNSVKAEYRLQTYARYPTIYGMNYPEIYTSIWKKKKGISQNFKYLWQLLRFTPPKVNKSTVASTKTKHSSKFITVWTAAFWELLDSNGLLNGQREP